MGSRHLQGIVKLSESMNIDIVEPNTEAREIAKSRLDEISFDKNKHKLVWHKSVNELTKESDLVLVATKAAGRVDLITQLLELGHSRFFIEKMVCQSSEEYDLLLKKMKSFDAKGWINTPRRCYEPYESIRKHINNSEIIHFSVSAGNMGLGTNAIHFIDLFSWLINDYKIRLSGEFLLNKTFTNKRGKDLLEFAGTIIGHAKNESVLSLTFLPYANLPLILNIVGKDNHIIIDETNARVFVVKGTNGLELKFRSEYQSNLTTEIVRDILEKDNCIFPTLDDSYFIHSELFRIFNTHIKKTLNEDKRLCPIT